MRRSAGTVKSMMRRIRDGVTLTELLAVLLIITIMASAAFVTYGVVIRNSREGEAKRVLDTVELAQQTRYRQKGAFASGAALESIEEAWTYRDANTPSTEATDVSVSVGTYQDVDAVGATVREGDRCLGARVYPANGRTSERFIWDVGSGSCTGARALSGGPS